MVGKPNAGKSTLLSRISRATPKVADYPFTTLEPQLGILELGGHRRMVVADIPGLIEGAHTGAGLGHDFLRHSERTRVIVHVLEVSPSDGGDPIENYHVIRNELARHSTELAMKPEIIALNKMDLELTDEDRQTAVDLIQDELNLPVFPISAVSGYGLTDVFEKCWKALRREDD